jgi:hypothetical protein
MVVPLQVAVTSLPVLRIKCAPLPVVNYIESWGGGTFPRAPLQAVLVTPLQAAVMSLPVEQGGAGGPEDRFVAEGRLSEQMDDLRSLLGGLEQVRRGQGCVWVVRLTRRFTS